ncbi:phosphatidylinositol 4,5-bisphosphate 3-kinase catalytic subunit gamma isoform-like [Polyodon spathula]|uniref:phosphatidylinositol 4,5-bisphosphate 3-kinase catalytic subunit gamma isoform-like n=1 Tax=Polyodon spathula TaxID=7913 RepID=UPI001B7E1F06|nr:phosphatidylinositol 4,5-bisphosphate 3-kinase catalytic subunit gamma isoform-like [Polyodon spathula]XP_041080818.1 phosphatidylinositol 4,5-bisphosphate 3-kinase catalytic subunit gamma isoform-like [Polyodon spathula]XP_041080820.1 phosphatidylinositol 4,5-bisphosphate 3-kinase catalytic subunit gamma isoform-like [Polyodon spathula]
MDSVFQETQFCKDDDDIADPKTIGQGNTLTFDCLLPTKKANHDANEIIAVEVNSQANVRQLRLHIWIQAKEKSCHPEIYHITDPESYQLLYMKGEEWYEIYDDYQILKTLDSVRYWGLQGMNKGTIIVKANPKDTEDSLRFQEDLSYMIGHDISMAVENRLDEFSFARRKLASTRRLEIRNRDYLAYATEPWAASTPIPKDLEAMLNYKVATTVYYNGTSHKLKADIKEPPTSLIKSLLKMMAEKGMLVEHAESGFVLKVCGREEYMTGERPLSDFLWIRQCLKTKQEIQLSMLPISTLQEDEVLVEDWPLVDNYTGLANTHEELALENKDINQILMISLWDCNQRFRVKLLGIDIPELPSKVPPNVYIEASILHGRTVLSSVQSKPMPFTDEVLWNVWLEFDFLLKNVPRGARLSFTVNGIVNEGNTMREGRSQPQGARTVDYKGKARILYFVNLLLIDHRSLLCQGEHILHMWPFPEKEEELFTYDADKMSSKTNPDAANSMAISIIMDSYRFPVVLPRSRASNPSCINPASSDLSPEDNSHPTPGLTNKGLFRGFTEDCSQYGASLPKFLSTTNWGDPIAVQNIHWLVSHWDPLDLDIDIALELLSIHFADEHVRRMSIKRLERLHNDELLRYLLQLVQALKVEPYHDSNLARFLIRRALQSKRIGHFFFWYLRSEITASPYFCDRFAVILEAYLLGCGQSMLEGFLKQVQVVESLHKVVTDIKKIIPEKSDLPANAALKLQEMLLNISLPKDFLIPYDPRIRAGEILVEKCKVMASKKKPLWLEFSSSDSEGASGSTIAIIFKHGDDLRQDMLVLKTMAIMDSIWQGSSLDLNLIPYGCISTGYNIGMIEVVRDAMTIASVQRSKGGTTGAFKNDALFEWIREKCQVQEIYYQAMERFVTSCAGYCVATYVLGIGDRHNDNIMITEQGNLFHIDFGHIMGNTKRFLGVNRERVPFVLTPDFLYMMGRVGRKSSLYFKRFKEICIRAYLDLRSNSNLLITLFSLMMLTGIPELSSTDDIKYLKEALQLGKDDNSAQEHFLNQISICENQGWTVQANWWIHMVAGIK